VETLPQGEVSEAMEWGCKDTPASRWADGRSMGDEQDGEKWMPNAQMPTQQALCRLLHLTPREAEVLCWVTQGKRNDEIGLILRMSPRTVQAHLEHIYRQLGVQTRMAVAVLRVLPLPWHWSQEQPCDGTVSQTIDGSSGGGFI